MTVKELFEKKYREWLKRMRESDWEQIKQNASAGKKHPAEYVYMCLEITVNDVKKNGGYTSDLWKEIRDMHSNKLLASNAHRQYSGHVTTYWLTKKGFKALNADHSIC